MRFLSIRHHKFSLYLGLFFIISPILIFVYYQWGGYWFSLQKYSQQIAQDIRRIEKMAMLTEGFNGSIPVGGYGVYFDSGDHPNSYILFADNGNYQYDSADKKIKEVFVKKNIQIGPFYLNNDKQFSKINIIFTPPEPIIRINGGFEYNNAAIFLVNKEINEKVTVFINSAGLVEVK